MRQIPACQDRRQRVAACRRDLRSWPWKESTWSYLSDIQWAKKTPWDYKVRMVSNTAVCPTSTHRCTNENIQRQHVGHLFGCSACLLEHLRHPWSVTFYDYLAGQCFGASFWRFGVSIRKLHMFFSFSFFNTLLVYLCQIGAIGVLRKLRVSAYPHALTSLTCSKTPGFAMPRIEGLGLWLCLGGQKPLPKTCRQQMHSTVEHCFFWLFGAYTLKLYLRECLRGAFAELHFMQRVPSRYDMCLRMPSRQPSRTFFLQAFEPDTKMEEVCQEELLLQNLEPWTLNHSLANAWSKARLRQRKRQKHQIIEIS